MTALFCGHYTINPHIYIIIRTCADSRRQHTDPVYGTIVQGEEITVRRNLFQNYIQDNPETILAKEFLGYLYENMKLWYNAISVFEQVAGKSVFYYFADIYFSLGWDYGKVKEYSAEEENYRKCLKENPNYPNALNNLGYRSIFRLCRWIRNRANLLFRHLALPQTSARTRLSMPSAFRLLTEVCIRLLLSLQLPGVFRFFLISSLIKK